MNTQRLLRQAALLCLALVLSWPWATAAHETELLCHQKGLAPAGDPPGPQRQYAPDREVITTHLALDVTPDFSKRSIQATARIQLKVAGRPTQEVRFDSVDLRIAQLTASRKVQAHQQTGDQLVVTFAEPIPTGETATVTVDYSAEPKEGLYFRTPEMGYREGDTHLFTQGEAIEARNWYPCMDTPNQMFTSEITCRVPAGMVVVSNGRLVSETKDDTTGLVAFHWSQEQPHANYLITLTAGYFKKIEGRYKQLPMAFYVPASEIHAAAPSFEPTQSIMEFFEKEIGVPYPWNKYDQVCVNDFVAGGMENTSATTLTDSTLFTEATENIQTSDGLVAHELAHQWFGDLVTCADWSHIWLNEGFATYYEALFEGAKHGRDRLLVEMHQRRQSLTGMANDTVPIVRRTYERPMELFNHLPYTKGSWVLHMLRAQLGEDLYRQCVKTFLERHRHRNAVTEDFRRVIEELSHRNFDRFFDQWLYHGHNPELEVTYQWDELAKIATLNVRQVQAVSDKVLLFEFPLPVRFKGKFGTVDQTLNITRNQQAFPITLPSAPDLVRIDPDVTVLCKLAFQPPGPMLQAQFEDQSDVVGRLLAVEYYAGRKDSGAVEKLKHALNQDSYFGIRVEASRGLRAIHSEAAFRALLASTDQPDARVRQQVVEDIGGFYNDEAFAVIQKTLSTEKNPAILGTAIQVLGAYPTDEVRLQILRFLSTPSFRNELAGNAIQAMRKQQDPAFIQPLLENLTTNSASFSTRGYNQALSTLAQLARESEDQKTKDQVRELLITKVKSPKRPLRLGAISALGTLGDPRATGVLETFTRAERRNTESQSAERALSELRREQKASEELRTLRQELLDLQKTQRELRREMDDFKKKPPQAAAPAGKKAAAQKAPAVRNTQPLASPKNQGASVPPTPAKGSR